MQFPLLGVEVLQFYAFSYGTTPFFKRNSIHYKNLVFLLMKLSENHHIK